ncbi:unnamed protein product [Danaus chrysippus]|uniref:(African queen) hypothetical protein n=1 Tax=Danaus chrysippus TaxID=151541 RepID=A0A8J2RG14_9NEOP|nr:unnamed protein product [Danaus chrysippus]
MQLKYMSGVPKYTRHRRNSSDGRHSPCVVRLISNRITQMHLVMKIINASVPWEDRMRSAYVRSDQRRYLVLELRTGAHKGCWGTEYNGDTM